MSIFDSMTPGGSRDLRRRLAERARGQNSIAASTFASQRAANAGAANRSAASATSRGVNAALAHRQASQAEAAANASAGAQFSSQAAAERQRAEDQLAQLDEARRGFRRQLFGRLVGAGAGLATTLGSQGQGEGGFTPALPGGTQTKTSGTLAPLIQKAAPIAGTAIGGPVGGMVGKAAGQALAPDTAQAVDQAIASPEATTVQPAGQIAMRSPQRDPALVSQLIARGRPAPVATPPVEEDEENLRLFERLFGGG